MGILDRQCGNEEEYGKYENVVNVEIPVP